jgi:hypothetical protein
VRRRDVRGWILFAILSRCLCSTSALADEPPHDTAMAHDLFDQGRRLLEQQDYQHACQKFEESRRLDSGGGGGTLLNLALCRELLGQTGTAWALFRQARSLAVRDRRDDRRDFADRHIGELTPQLSRLRVIVPSTARLAGLAVRRNGILLPQGEWGEALVVDPGEQILDVTAPGRRSVTLRVHIAPGATPSDAVIPVLRESPQNGNRSRSSNSHSRWIHGPQNVAGVIVGTAGLATLSIGGLLGARAIRKQHNADALCPTYEHCDPNGIALSSAAVDDGHIATATVIGGAVMLAVGIGLFLTAPSHVDRPATALPVSASWMPVVAF